jgi:DNA topoisomerase-1
MDGPVKDDDGNRVQIRFQRKTKEQYLMTEVDGSASGWRADYDGKQWVVSKKEKKKSTRAKAKKS